MNDNHGFNPSRRAYQTNFRRWNFPSKHNPLHRDLDLVARVRDLWERNFTHRAMVQKLTEDGYDIKSRELMRLRTKHRLLLRHANGVQPNDLEQQLLDAVRTDQDEVERRREERRTQMLADSDERKANNKRRRRTRNYGVVPADPVGPPRFPSETTLDESKTFLSLDNATYQRIRDRFQKICEENGVIKKTQAGPEKWQAVKTQLIEDDEHLRNVFWNDTSNESEKALALDVICLDVTKRMRTMDKSISIADAKNILGLNPEQNRRMRDSLYAVLKADGFISITEAGDRYDQLKQEWVNRTPYLQQLLDPADPRYAGRLRAFNFICRDVVKRVRDDNKNPAKANFMPPILPLTDAAASAAAGLQALQATNPAVQSSPPQQMAPPAPIIQAPPARAPASRQVRVSRSAAAQPVSNVSNVHIDPSLLPPANGGTYEPINQPASPVAAFFKPHPRSQIHKAAKMWLGTLNTQTLSEIRSMLASKWPDAIFNRIEGMARGPDGDHIPYLIEDDEELQAYLEHVAGGKAVFVALMTHA